MSLRIGLVGLGTIARAQHLPVAETAMVSRGVAKEFVEGFHLYPV